MRRMLTMFLAGLLTLGLIGGLAGTATAQEPPEEVLTQDEAGEAVVGDESQAFAPDREPGELHARGTGAAGVEGKGLLAAAGMGRLYVKDVAGDMDIRLQGRGEKTRLPRGWVLYEGYGRAQLRGSHFKAIATGKHLSIHAVGKGIFRLRGEGRFDVNGVTGSWPARGTYTP